MHTAAEAEVNAVMDAFDYSKKIKETLYHYNTHVMCHDEHHAMTIAYRHSIVLH
jgi:hypothetical protein